MSSDPANPYPSPAAAPALLPGTPRTHAWKNGSLGFHDLLDAINPLQHIPIIGAVYRWITGDVPGNVAQLAGDTLYGGPIGFASSLFSLAFKEETGKDPGAMAIALLGGGDTAAAQPPAAGAAPMAVADASPSQSTRTGAAPLAPAPPAAPLVKPPPPRATAAGPPGAAERAFLAETAAREQGLLGRRPGVGARPITAPIPLKLTGPALPLTRLRLASPIALPAPATPPPSSGAPTTAPGPSPSSDIPQRMLEALDKYRQLQQERGAGVDLQQ